MNIILSLLFFFMGLGILVAFIGPISEFLDIAQQSDNLNCKGYIFDSNETHPLSFDNESDGGNSGDPIACLFIKPIVAYILLVFVVGGVSAVLGGKGAEEEETSSYYSSP